MGPPIQNLPAPKIECERRLLAHFSKNWSDLSEGVGQFGREGPTVPHENRFRDAVFRGSLNWLHQRRRQSDLWSPQAPEDRLTGWLSCCDLAER